MASSSVLADGPTVAQFSEPSGSTAESSVHHRSADNAPDSDDDEKLFAELEREVEEMDDESNYPNFNASASNTATSNNWIGRGANNDDDADSKFEVGFDMAEFREKRMQEIRAELANRKSGKAEADNSSFTSYLGKLTEITHEKELIHLSSQHSAVAIHFFHKQFERCKLLDRHLEVLARLHPSTLFLKANVTNCPFLVQKLGIKVLPCIITFKQGVSKDKIVGFEELGNTDRFTTGALEWRLGQSGIIDPRRNQKPILGFAEQSKESVGAGVVGASHGNYRDDQDDEDDGWDD